MVTVEGRFEPRNAAVPVLLWPLIKPMLKRITTGILLELERFLASGGATHVEQALSIVLLQLVGGAAPRERSLARLYRRVPMQS
jgi:hypothetical protein